MKTIFKYVPGQLLCKITCGIFFVMCVANVYGQRSNRGRAVDSAIFLSIGASKTFVQRQAFDQWTQQLFSLTEPYRPSFYMDISFVYRRLDLGVALNFGTAFETEGGFVGYRLTGDRSPIGSWINLELGSLSSHLRNVTPPTYDPVPAGQDLSLDYDGFYLSLISKNYFNFLSYTAKLGRARIPVNTGFFVGAGWQPAGRKWSYGYYDQDSVYHAQRIKPIPKLGKVQATAGVFMSF